MTSALQARLGVAAAAAGHEPVDQARRPSFLSAGTASKTLAMAARDVCRQLAAQLSSPCPTPCLHFSHLGAEHPTGCPYGWQALPDNLVTHPCSLEGSQSPALWTLQLRAELRGAAALQERRHSW